MADIGNGATINVKVKATDFDASVVREKLQEAYDSLADKAEKNIAFTVEKRFSTATAQLDTDDLAEGISDELVEKVVTQLKAALGAQLGKSGDSIENIFAGLLGRTQTYSIDDKDELVAEKKGGKGEERDWNKWEEKWQPVIMKGVALGAQGIKSVATESMNFLQMIYRYVKQSSPLMQGIESLFNLAVQLFFLPFGTALGETLLPSLLDLVDDVADMWDAMDGMTLGEMADYMVAQAGDLFGKYFVDIGESLADQGGILGSIGSFLINLGNFIEDNGAQLLETIFNVASLFMNYFKEFVAIYVGLEAAQLAAQVAGISAFNLTGKAIGTIIAASAIGTATAALAGLEVAGFAEGGYVPATQGGALAVVAEGGEGEYIVPESKAKSFAEGVTGSGGNTYNISISGYTDSELKRYVTDIVNEQVAFSRLKGSF